MIKKKEIILIVIIIFALILLLFVIKTIKTKGKYVIVRLDGKIVNVYNLSENGTYVLNNGTNILCISNFKAYLLSATCPDKLCVKQGEIDEISESIVCLPNKLSIVISNNKECYEYQEN